MEALQRFKEIFWDSFHRPKLHTEPFIQKWKALEPINDVLAGPLYAIYTKGECEYVFNDSLRFPGVYHADDFLSWCIDLIEKYRAAIEELTPQNEEEKEDKRLLLYQTDIKMELADLAFAILQLRHQHLN